MNRHAAASVRRRSWTASLALYSTILAPTQRRTRASVRTHGGSAVPSPPAVQTSTPVLASILRDLNPEVALFANTIRNLPDVRNFVEPDVVTLFFGALNREKDWAPFIPVLNAVADKAGERLRFSVVHDQQFFEALHTPHKQFTPTCDHDTYMNLLGQSEISFTMPRSIRSRSWIAAAATGGSSSSLGFWTAVLRSR